MSSLQVIAAVGGVLIVGLLLMSNTRQDEAIKGFEEGHPIPGAAPPPPPRPPYEAPGLQPYERCCEYYYGTVCDMVAPGEPLDCPDRLDLMNAFQLLKLYLFRQRENYGIMPSEAQLAELLRLSEKYRIEHPPLPPGPTLPEGYLLPGGQIRYGGTIIAN